MSAILLTEIPRIQGMRNNNTDDDGLMLFAPLTNATGPCFVGGALSSYKYICSENGKRVPRNTGENHSTHPNSSFHYVFDGRYMVLEKVEDMYQLRRNAFTFITWTRGSNVNPLSLSIKCGGKRLSFNIAISSGRLKFPKFNDPIAKLEEDGLYKLAIVFNVSHVVLYIDENQTSWRVAEWLFLKDCHISNLKVGAPLRVSTGTLQLSLFCFQLWNKELAGEEISAEFRRCEKWRPLPAVTSSTTFSAYEKSLNRRCDPAIVPAAVDTNIATETSSSCVIRIALSVMLGLLLVGAFIAHIFHVKLANGTTFDDRCARRAPTI